MTAYLPGVMGRRHGQERRALECGEHRCYQSALGSGLGLAPGVSPTGWHQGCLRNVGKQPPWHGAHRVSKGITILMVLGSCHSPRPIEHCWW